MKYVKLIVIMNLFASAAFAADDFTVNKKVKSSLNLSNVTVTETGRNTATGKFPTGSYINLEITADYDSGWGWVQDVALQETNVEGGKLDAAETSTLAVLGLIQPKTAEIPMGDTGAVGGSSGTLHIPIHVGLIAWSGRMQGHQWTYRILSGNAAEPVKTIVIQFDKTTGWSATL